MAQYVRLYEHTDKQTANSEPIPFLPDVTGTPEDSPLSVYGLQQADELATFLLAQQDPPIEAVFSSPYYRCLQTIEPFSKAANLPIHIEPGFS